MLDELIAGFRFPAAVKVKDSTPTSSDVRAYFLNGGASSGKSGLDVQGRLDAIAGAQFVDATADGAITRIVTSDVLAAKQAADIAAQTLGIPVVQQDPRLEAFDPNSETPQAFEARLDRALREILNAPGVPLLVGDGSITGYLERTIRTFSSDDWRPHYATYSLLNAGGVLVLTQTAIDAVFRANMTGQQPVWGGSSKEMTVVSRTDRAALAVRKAQTMRRPRGMEGDGSLSVYDDVDDDGFDLTQAIHDAAAALGAQCFPVQSAVKSKSKKALNARSSSSAAVLARARLRKFLLDQTLSLADLPKPS